MTAKRSGSNLSPSEDAPEFAERSPTVYHCDDCGGIGFGEQGMRCCGEAMETLDGEPAEHADMSGLMQNVFGMNPTELDICIELMRQGPMSAEAVAETIDCSPSYANRLLGHLKEIHVVEEESAVLDEGGRKSTYRHTSIEKLQRLWQKELLVWTAEALQVIDEEMVAEKEAALQSAERFREAMQERQDS